MHSIHPGSQSLLGVEERNPLTMLARSTIESLPPLKHFEKGVEALIRAHGPAYSTSKKLPRLLVPKPPGCLISECFAGDHTRGSNHPTPSSVTLVDRSALSHDCGQQPWKSHAGSLCVGSEDAASQNLPPPVDRNCHPSSVIQQQSRHMNQKYTTEEGDFIMYAFLDKKMDWRHVKLEFDHRFGCTPERSIPGLQAWLYRMNERIPVWDRDGWLCFDHEDDVQPRYNGIKCREYNYCDKSIELPGIAMRYPERAVKYTWVDPEIKAQAQDWARKRDLQHNERRERRRKNKQRLQGICT